MKIIFFIFIQINTGIFGLDRVKAQALSIPERLLNQLNCFYFQSIGAYNDIGHGL